MPFLIDGEEVEVVERIASGVVVRRVFGDGDEEDYGSPEIVAKVFDAPPTERIDARIARLKIEEERLENRIAELAAAERSATSAAGRLKSFKNLSPALASIEDFMERRITHYLFREYHHIRLVEAVNGCITDGEGYSRETKLLCLFGKTDGDFQWRMNHYSDSSGSWTDVEGFTSRESALARVQVLVNSFTGNIPHILEAIYTSGIKCGVTIPDELRRLVLANRSAVAAQTVADARLTLQKAEAALKVIQDNCDAK